MTLRLVVPDLVSNSYFPAIAAVELKHFADEGLDVRCDHVFPVDRCLALLRDGGADLVAGAAHAVPQYFPFSEGSSVVTALSRHMYWLLVIRADIQAARGDLNALRGLRVGAAPVVEQGLRALLEATGLDPARDGIAIGPVPGAAEPGVSFGVQAARALEAGSLDAFWANGLGAEVAIRRGAGRLLLDVRRGEGPPAVRDITFPALVASNRLPPDARSAAARAIAKTQAALRADVSLATRVGEALFPAYEATLIADVVARDLPAYDVGTPDEMMPAVTRFISGLDAKARESRA